MALDDGAHRARRSDRSRRLPVPLPDPATTGMNARSPSRGGDLSSYRDEFPVLESKAYLISASLGPISRRAQSYLNEYLEAWAMKGAPDLVWEEHIFPRMRSVKETFARLVGADTDELSITTNVSLALSTIASCMNFTGSRK